MYLPKRSYDNVFDSRMEPLSKESALPRRALPDRDQKLLDATVLIKELSLDEDLGYFVSRCIHGTPCTNDVHGLHYQTNA